MKIKGCQEEATYKLMGNLIICILKTLRQKNGNVLLCYFKIFIFLKPFLIEEILAQNSLPRQGHRSQRMTRMREQSLGKIQDAVCFLQVCPGHGTSQLMLTPGPLSN